MKKVYMMLAVCAIALASCKKDYTCVCTIPGIPGVDVDGDGVLDTPEVAAYDVEVTGNFTKKDAEEWCEAEGADICKLK